MTILVTGAEGMLGSAVLRAAHVANVDVVGLTKQDCDIGDRIQVAEVMARYQDPVVVINCAGIVKEREDISFIEMRRVDTLGPMILARHAARVVHISTDCVFDGKITCGSYTEDSKPCPQDPYGERKLEGESIPGPHLLVVRASFVGLGQRGLLHWLLNHPQDADVPGFTNWIWNGWTADGLAYMLLELATSDITGLLHVPGPNVMSKAFLLQRVASRLRPDLMIQETLAPEDRRMVLESTIPSSQLPGLNPLRRHLTWDWMLDELEAHYRAGL
ncbi:hypothetical protein LCGC14_1431130 [marine sediment metagenome]|uniref:RmlD-like substrate binding domain-containing protein n=1 Tax=marine sediment metagenome TaxID=412755 RepID=A0A0F9M432_9ZZZZ